MSNRFRFPWYIQSVPPLFFAGLLYLSCRIFMWRVGFGQKEKKPS